MIRRFDYRICRVQSSRVTFVNGEWQGTRPMQAEHAEESLHTHARWSGTICARPATTAGA
jgi:hypothetical protein